MVRRKIIVIAAAVLSLCLLLVSCGGNNVNENGDPEKKKEEPSKTYTEDREGYFFKFGETTVYMGGNADEAVNALGEYLSCFEAPSCAFEGTDRTYSYSNFTLATFPDGDTDRVLSIILVNDLIGTPEGTAIGDAASSVVEKYGGDYEEVNGSFIYKKSNTKLTFIIRDDEVYSIQYYFECN